MITKSNVMSDVTLTLRYIFRGQTLRNGRLHSVALADGAATLCGATVVAGLAELPDVDLRRFVPYFYDKPREGWSRLRGESVLTFALAAASPRVEVLLEDSSQWGVARALPDAVDSAALPEGAGGMGDAAEMRGGSRKGYFGIGIVRGKSEVNHGTLYRSAYQLGAAFIASIGARYEKHRVRSSDTLKSWTRIPFHQHDDWPAFAANAPYGAQWVAIEMSEHATPLDEFVHPRQAVYLLGAEDTGLSGAIAKACAHRVFIPCLRASSYNVATAGALVMYDRLAKQRASGVAKSGEAAAAEIEAEHEAEAAALAAAGASMKRRRAAS